MNFLSYDHLFVNGKSGDYHIVFHHLIQHVQPCAPPGRTHWLSTWTFVRPCSKILNYHGLNRSHGGQASLGMNTGHVKDIEKLEADLWAAADNLRANSKLTSSDYFLPVLGVIFLRHAANRFEEASRQIAADQASGRMPKDYGVFEPRVLEDLMFAHESTD